MMKDIDKLIVVGDRVLIKPNDAVDRTHSGLYLPAGYKDKENVQSGYIVKCGPGYPLPDVEEGESWNRQKNAIEIKYNNEKYFIVPQSAILMVERDDF